MENSENRTENNNNKMRRESTLWRLNGYASVNVCVRATNEAYTVEYKGDAIVRSSSNRWNHIKRVRKRGRTSGKNNSVWKRILHQSHSDSANKRDANKRDHINDNFIDYSSIEMEKIFFNVSVIVAGIARSVLDLTSTQSLLDYVRLS